MAIIIQIPDRPRPERMVLQLENCANEPFMPCNGHENDLFRDYWCNHCKQQDEEGFPSCEHYKRSCFGEQPEVWVFDAEGVATCKAFEVDDVLGVLEEEL